MANALKNVLMDIFNRVKYAKNVMKIFFFVKINLSAKFVMKDFICQKDVKFKKKKKNNSKKKK